MQGAFLSAAQEGKTENAFADRILIVDEVDDLVVNDDSLHSYNSADVEKTAAFVSACEALSKGSGKPAGVSKEMWREAQSAQSQANSKKEDWDYLVQGTNIVFLEQGKEPNTPKTAKWLVYLRYTRFQTEPRYSSNYLTFTTAYMFSKFFCIFGLTGSVGGNAEKTFLRETYM